MVLHLQNFDIIWIIVPNTAQSNEHTGKDCLDCIFLFDPDLGLCATHIIDGGFCHGHYSGDSSTNDVCACFSITAVTGDRKTCDSVTISKEFASSHNYRAILVISTLV